MLHLVATLRYMAVLRACESPRMRPIAFLYERNLACPIFKRVREIKQLEALTSGPFLIWAERTTPAYYRTLFCVVGRI